MIFFYISLITYLSYNILKYRSLLISLEAENFNALKYNKRILNDKKRLFLGPELFIALILIVISLTFNIKVIEICVILSYMILFLYALKTKKDKLKITKKHIIRIILLVLIYLLLNVWFCLDYASYHNPNGLIFENSPLYYIILIAMSYLSPYILFVVNFITKVFGRIFKKKDKKNTKKTKK